MNPKPQSTDIQYSYTFAVMNVGAPACGINSAVRSFVRNGIWKGCRILAIQDGFEGLIQGDLKELDWNSVYGWTGLGGSLLGRTRNFFRKKFRIYGIPHNLLEYLKHDLYNLR